MKLGSKILLIIFLSLIFSNRLISEQKITSTPLINIDEIKPSFEELDEKNENISSNQIIKEKKKLKF